MSTTTTNELAELRAEIAELKNAIADCDDSSKATRLQLMIRAREVQLRDLRRRVQR